MDRSRSKFVQNPHFGRTRQLSRTPARQPSPRAGKQTGLPCSGRPSLPAGTSRRPGEGRSGATSGISSHAITSCSRGGAVDRHTSHGDGGRGRGSAPANHARPCVANELGQRYWVGDGSSNRRTHSACNQLLDFLSRFNSTTSDRPARRACPARTTVSRNECPQPRCSSRVRVRGIEGDVPVPVARLPPFPHFRLSPVGDADARRYSSAPAGPAAPGT